MGEIKRSIPPPRKQNTYIHFVGVCEAKVLEKKYFWGLVIVNINIASKKLRQYLKETDFIFEWKKNLKKHPISPYGSGVHSDVMKLSDLRTDSHSGLWGRYMGQICY